MTWVHWKHDTNITLHQTYMDAASCPPPARFGCRSQIFSTPGHCGHNEQPTSRPPVLLPTSCARIAYCHEHTAIRRCGPSPHPATTPAGDMRAHVTTTSASGVASGYLASTSAMRTRDHAGHCHISASPSPFSRTHSQSSKD
ncbi:hypothetical protein B0H19DRAFT_1265278 [Mycena capillaripes]|nr:hypothetical protein B0H19DRAFT_1265278 [Mycena capillaripes]